MVTKCADFIKIYGYFFIFEYKLKASLGTCW